MPHLFCFGLGYTALGLIRRLAPLGWTISGTNRTGASVEGCSRAHAFAGTAAVVDGAFDDCTHLLISVPPGDDGDPVLRFNHDELARRASQFSWVGYLSTTGVYGDRQGDWVDEESSLVPTTRRGHRRLEAENAWLALFVRHGLPVHIFRLAGIYGPGRNQLVLLHEGRARRIVKPGQVFSRVHVDDIAGVLQASIARPHPGRAYNVSDDEPGPPQDVVAYAAYLMGRSPPPEISLDEAQLSPFARSFYADSKRISNRRIKDELGYRLIYPTYREGLRALVPVEQGSP